MVLTGGCFQNVPPERGAVAALQRSRLRAVWHRRVPPNDGGIALGQAVWAGWTDRPGRVAMCLAVPGQILSTSGDDPLMRVGRVDFGGVLKEINLAYTPEAEVGDYVLVHVGFAITVIDEAEAEQVFAHLREIGELEELEERRSGDGCDDCQRVRERAPVTLRGMTVWSLRGLDAGVKPRPSGGEHRRAPGSMRR